MKNLKPKLIIVVKSINYKLLLHIIFLTTQEILILIGGMKIADQNF